MRILAGKARRQGKQLIADETSRGTLAITQSEDQMVTLTFTADDGAVLDDLVLMPMDAEVKLAGGFIVIKFSTSDARQVSHKCTYCHPAGTDLVNNFMVDSDADYDMTSPVSQHETIAHEQPPASTNDLLRSIIAQNSQSQPQVADVELSQVLTVPKMLSMISNDPSVAERLYSSFPDGLDHTPDELNEIVRSSQFSGTLRSLGSAIRSGQLGPLFAQLGLDPSIMSVRDFVKAVREQSKRI